MDAAAAANKMRRAKFFRKRCLMENTLLLGNGFTRSIVPNVKSWDALFTCDKTLSNTFRYEKQMMDCVQSLNSVENPDEAVKKKLIAEIQSSIVLTPGLRSALKPFEGALSQHNITNILTTNYEVLIETILDIWGYNDVTKDMQKTMLQGQRYTEEEIYNIRTRKKYKKISGEGSGHIITLWKIHGDADTARESGNKSIILGFDQYCGQLAKLWAYLKDEYKSNDDKDQASASTDLHEASDRKIGIDKPCEAIDPRPLPFCNTHIDKKIQDKTYDGISWAELFFCSNLYIAGFGMGFAEIDLWWLINCRARMRYVKGLKVDNEIHFLYHPEFDDPKNAPEMGKIMDMLRCFDVDCEALPLSHKCEQEKKKSDEEQAVQYLTAVFSQIPKPSARQPGNNI